MLYISHLMYIYNNIVYILFSICILLCMFFIYLHMSRVEMICYELRSPLSPLKGEAWPRLKDVTYTESGLIRL